MPNNDFPKLKLIATCAFGLEKLVNKELKDLGIWIDHNENGRVIFEGTKEDIVKANRWLRTAERIQILIAQFPAQTFDELFDQIHALPWPTILPNKAQFPVLCTTANSKLHHEPSIQSISKKAIVKKLQAHYKTTGTIMETGPIYSILVRFFNDICTVSIDTSGDSLHKRGYRTQTTLAPIKETLAAALVKFAEWPNHSTTAEPNTLIDPFCGSGTILIEAALIALNKAPGLNRSFTFETWPEFPSLSRTRSGIESVDAEPSSASSPKLLGFDIDPSAISIAKENAKRAGVDHLIKFTVSDFHKIPPETFHDATIITNPPYGERLSSTFGEKYSERITDHLEINKLYHDLGEIHRKAKTSSLFVITSLLDFEKIFGQPADRNRKLYNGKIKCHLYQYAKSPSL